MPSQLPTKQDFPESLTIDIIPPSSNHQSPVNVLILFHGLGDTQAPFARLAGQLNLPETCCISVRGLEPLPGLFVGTETPSYHWGDDVLFDQGRGEIELDAGFEKVRNVLSRDLLDNGLFGKCGYTPRDLLFYGFGQGGMAALTLVAGRSEEFGGVVSVGGGLKTTATTVKSKTPILICGGSRSKEVTAIRLTALKQGFQEVEYVKWSKAEDSMPKSREEMLPIMKFFARRLRSRAGVPEGAVEIRFVS